MRRLVEFAAFVAAIVAVAFLVGAYVQGQRDTRTNSESLSSVPGVGRA